MNRWIWIKRSLSATKRGVTSVFANVFVCLIVLLPIGLAVMQYGQFFRKDVAVTETRKVVATDQMNVRPIDRNASPIKPFEQPLITVTFDDGWESIYTTGLPLFQKHGIPTTQYVLSGVFEDSNYLTIEQVKALKKAGHEIACHSIDHSDLTAQTNDMLIRQLQDCKTVYERELGTPVKHFASPYGRSNPDTISAIKKLYSSHRNTNGDITTNGVSDQDVNVKKYFNPYNIHAITIRRETTKEQLQQAIDYTVANNGWLVLNYHEVEEGESTFGLDSRTLDAQLIAISQAKARVVTLGQFMEATK